MPLKFRGQISVEFISYLSALFLFFTIISAIVFLLSFNEVKKIKSLELRLLTEKFANEMESVIRGGEGYFVRLKLARTTLIDNYTIVYYPAIGIVRGESGIESWTARIINSTAVINGNAVEYVEIHAGDIFIAKKKNHYIELEVLR